MVYDYYTARTALANELSFEKGLKHSIKKWSETTHEEYNRDHKCGLCLVAENVYSEFENEFNMGSRCHTLGIECPFVYTGLCERMNVHLDKKDNFFSLKRSNGFSRLMLKTLKSKKLLDRVKEWDRSIKEIL